jgi:hypothetical protein
MLLSVLSISCGLSVNLCVDFKELDLWLAPLVCDCLFQVVLEFGLGPLLGRALLHSFLE